MAHGFIQIGASNAFNLIDQTLLLHNVKILCPEIATYINNCYMKPSRLFIAGRKKISSSKGTTQEDLIAMGIYALGLMPLLTSIISNNAGNLIHVAFPDDLTGVGKIHELIEWWKNILNYGPYLGYYVNVSKSWLIMKKEYIEIANEKVQDYNIKIITDGEMRCLNENKEEFVIARVSECVKRLEF